MCCIEYSTNKLLEVTRRVSRKRRRSQHPKRKSFSLFSKHVSLSIDLERRYCLSSRAGSSIVENNYLPMSIYIYIYTIDFRTQRRIFRTESRQQLIQQQPCRRSISFFGILSPRQVDTRDRCHTSPILRSTQAQDKSRINDFKDRQTA